MKVKFVYRNYKKLHTIHSSIVKYPPKGVEYIVPKEKKYLKNLYPIYKKFKGSKISKKLIEILKDKLFLEKNSPEIVDLIHYINYVPHNFTQNIPYVVDFEHIMGLTDFTRNDKLFEKKVRNFLMNTNCKAILPLSRAAQKTLKLKMGHEYSFIEDKVRVIYPALKSIKNHSTDDNKKMQFLFVGNDVYRKGLHELLEAFDMIPNHLAELKVVSLVPKELKDTYKKENIKFFTPQYSHNDILEKFFCRADMFVMPTHRDTFGMVFLDALSCGTPVISTNQFAIPELIEDGKTGFLLETKNQYLWDEDPTYTFEMDERMKEAEKKLIKDLHEKMMYCLKNPKEVRRMGDNAKKLFFNPDGKFSVERRNRLLKEVYEKALEIY